MKIYQNFYLKTFQILVMKFPIYVNMRVFVISLSTLFRNDNRNDVVDGCHSFFVDTVNFYTSLVSLILNEQSPKSTLITLIFLSVFILAERKVRFDQTFGLS